MSMVRFLVFALTLVSGSAAYSDTMSCTSIQDTATQGRFVVEAKFERSFFKGHAREGSFSYRAKDQSSAQVTGEFACREANAKGIIFCGVTTEPDKNIRRIVQHPKLGFMIQFADEPGVTLFDCRAALN